MFGWRKPTFDLIKSLCVCEFDRNACGELTPLHTHSHCPQASKTLNYFNVLTLLMFGNTFGSSFSLRWNIENIRNVDKILTQIISDWIPWEYSATLNASESFLDRRYTKIGHDFQSALPIVRPNLQLSHLLMNRQQLRLCQYRLFPDAAINANDAWRTWSMTQSIQPGSKENSLQLPCRKVNARQIKLEIINSIGVHASMAAPR